MKKNRVLRTVFLSAALAILALVLTTPVASAHTSAPAYRIVFATSEIPAIPNANIITKHHKSVFSTDEVDCHFQSGKACASITNLTSKDQEIDNLGHEVVVLQPGQVGLISVSTGPGTYPLNLATNNQATLDVVVS